MLEALGVIQACLPDGQTDFYRRRRFNGEIIRKETVDHFRRDPAKGGGGVKGGKEVAEGRF